MLDRHSLHWGDFELQHRLFFELRECDLRYHDIDPQRGLFTLLENTGRVRRTFSAEEISTAQNEPPATRAQLRAQVIRWARDHDRRGDTLLDWGRVAFPGPRGVVNLDDPFAIEDSRLVRRFGGEDEEIDIRILDVDVDPAGPGPFANMTSRVRRLFGR
jgi:proteasome accessory factor A